MAQVSNCVVLIIILYLLDGIGLILLSPIVNVSLANAALGSDRSAGDESALRLIQVQPADGEGNDEQRRQQQLIKSKLMQSSNNQLARRAPRPSSRSQSLGAGGLGAHNAARRDTSIVTAEDSFSMFKADPVIERLLKLYFDLHLGCVRLGQDENNLEIFQFTATTDIATAMHVKLNKARKSLASTFKSQLAASYTHGEDGNGSTAKTDRCYLVVTPKITGGTHGTRHSEDIWYSLYHPALTHENIRSGNVPTFHYSNMQQ